MKKVLSNKYEIIEKIGGGGMADVYKANQRDLKRVVAIKIPREQLISDSLFIERFMREARSMARLKHENIIHIYDIDKDNEISYIAMEYGMQHEEGTDLKSLLSEQGRLDPEETTKMAIQIASALAHAHKRGIIHRDIKPGNILVLASRKIKVTDFGIASARDENTLTSPDNILGTPEYMSPEQVRGEPVDPRMDLYSLGMVLYKMLTSLTPFDGDSKITIIGKLINIKNEISLIFPEETPDDLKAIIIRLLKRDPQERYPDAQSLIEDLEKSLKPKITISPRKFRPQLFPTLLGGGAALILISIIIWFAFGDRDKYQKIQPLKSSTTTEESGRVSDVTLYTEIQAIQKQMSLTKAEAIKAKESSEVTGTDKYAPDRYEAGITYMNEADILYRQTQSMIANKDYDSAKENLTRTIEYYKSAEAEFNKGQRKAEKELNDRQTKAERLMRRVKSFQEEASSARAKGLATSIFQDATDKFEQGKKALDKVDYKIATAMFNQSISGFKKAKEAAIVGARIARKKRMEEVGKLLNSFRIAYKNKDIKTLKNLSDISSSKIKSLKQFFNNYSTIEITFGEMNFIGNKATAILTIVSLTDRHGNQVKPGKAWKDTLLTTHHGSKGWEKIKW